MRPSSRPSDYFAVRKLFWFGGFFGLGCLCGVSFLPAMLQGIIGGVLLCVGVAALFLPRCGRMQAPLSLLGLGTGLVWVLIFSSLLLAPAARLEGTESAFTATVISAPKETARSSKVQVRMDGVGTVTLYGEETAGLCPGDRIEGTGTFSAPTVNMLAKGNRLTGLLDSVEVTGTRLTPAVLAARTSALLKSGIETLFTGDAAGLYTALLTGDKSGLSAGLSSALSRCGLSHMVAVSGMHMGVLASVFLVWLKNRRARLLCIPVLLFFGLMIGSPSAYRALFMEALLLIAPLFRREDDPLTSLSFALLVLLALNPYSVRAVSLQLSFCAMAGILLGLNRVTAVLRERLALPEPFPLPLCRIWNGILGVVSLSLCASVPTMPLLILYFRQLSLITIPANLLVVWLLPAALMTGLISVILVLLFPAAAPILRVIPGILAKLILLPVKALGGLNFSALTLNNTYAYIFLAVCLLLPVLCLLLPGLRSHPGWLSVSAAAALCLCLLLNRLSLQRTGLTAEMLDVGQGSCTLLLSQGRTAAIDCGGDSYDSAGDILADELQSYGINRLDFLIFTHYDRDHINGIESLFDRIRVDTVLVPTTAEDAEWAPVLAELCEQQGTDLRIITEEVICTVGRASLEVLPPLLEDTDNNTGLAALCTCGDFHLLVTGDMDSAAEKLLLATHDLPDLDVLIAGHHGSATSTSAELLDALTPETVVISVGAGNSYGHPAEETLQRLAERNITIYRTDYNGTVTLTVN